MNKMMVLMTISSLLLAGAAFAVGGGEREIVSLNGDWQIEESVGATEMPATFTQRGRGRN